MIEHLLFIINNKLIGRYSSLYVRYQKAKVIIKCEYVLLVINLLRPSGRRQQNTSYYLIIMHSRPFRQEDIIEIMSNALTIGNRLDIYLLIIQLILKTQYIYTDKNIIIQIRNQYNSNIFLYRYI
jgi:hypothetical protein